MKRALIAVGMMLATAVVGCSKKTDVAPKAGAELSPVSQPPVAAAPLQPVAAEPTPAPAWTPAPAPVATVTPAEFKPASAGKSYTVKKGDTLYSISKATYGDGKPATITKIVAANPGLDASKIKVGQKITLP